MQKAGGAHLHESRFSRAPTSLIISMISWLNGNLVSWSCSALARRSPHCNSRTMVGRASPAMESFRLFVVFSRGTITAGTKG